MNPQLEAALALARVGKFVFPCVGKQPRIEDNLNASTTDETIIRNWWDWEPDSNVGMNCGKSGLLVLDVDPAKGGNESLAQLRKMMDLPENPTVITGGGGYHFYFVCHESFGRSTTGLLPGIDIRARGGYVIVPPGIHPDTGQSYAWFGGAPPTSLRKVPQGLLHLLNQHKSSAGVTATEGPVHAGGRNAYLASVAGSMRRRGLGEGPILAALRETNTEQCVPPLDEEEVQVIARSICRYAPEQIDLGKLAAAYARTNRAGGKNKPLVTQMSTVTPVDVEWLWDPRVPTKLLTLLEGNPGDGKTWISLDFAAAVTTGRCMPDDTRPREPGNVVFFLSEDGLEDTIAPRFKMLGGDPSRLFVVTGMETSDGKEGQISLGDLETIINVMEQVKPKLVVFDPVQSFLGSGVDANAANQVRPLLNGLMRVMQRYNCAGLIVRHLRKGAKPGEIMAGLGSVDFFAQPRTVLRTEVDPETLVRTLKQIKNNLGRFAYDVNYVIRDGMHWSSPTAFATFTNQPEPDEDLAQLAMRLV